LLVAVALAALAVAAVGFVQAEGRALYFGDAAAHLNIARRMVDGRTLGYHQIGTVWLPLPHFLFALLAKNDFLWRTGLAGAIPCAAAWVLAGWTLYRILRMFFGISGAAAGTIAFAANLNLLYLAATPMTEAIFFAALTGMLYCALRAAEGSWKWAAGAGAWAIAAALTRYEGWFLLPFVSLYLLGQGKDQRWLKALVFAAVAGLGPLYWLAHNAVMYSDPLHFYWGPDSAQAIYQRGIERGVPPHPGDRDWWGAIRQFAIATKAVNGWPLILMAAAGAWFAIRKGLAWLLVLLSLSPIFYVYSLHSGGTPIYVPEVWPYTHYNTRYALAALPLLCVMLAALADRLPGRSWVLGLVAPGWFLVAPVLTWNEGEANSRPRREWTRQVAELLAKEYKKGEGILMPFGDLTGILQQAGIPIRESLHQEDLLEYERALARPDLFLSTRWAVVIAGEPAGAAVFQAQYLGLPYKLKKRISLKNAPVIEVWRRELPEKPVL
jgi:hypothetical protein